MAYTPIIQLKNIYKSFGETEVLSDLSLDVSEKEFITLLGPSGCGKTTLLSLLLGLTPPGRSPEMISAART